MEQVSVGPGLGLLHCCIFMVNLDVTYLPPALPYLLYSAPVKTSYAVLSLLQSRLSLTNSFVMDPSPADAHVVDIARNRSIRGLHSGLEKGRGSLSLSTDL